MIYQRCYELNIVEERNYFSAIIRHCEVNTQEWIFEWDKYADDNEFSSFEETKEEFEKFFEKEFQEGYDFYVYDFEMSWIKKIENFTIDEGDYLIFEPLEWHEFLNNWCELSSPEEVSSEEEEELFSLWKSKFPAFDLYYFYSYYATEAFGETLASYL